MKIIVLFPFHPRRKIHLAVYGIYQIYNALTFKKIEKNSVITSLHLGYIELLTVVLGRCLLIIFVRY